ILTDKKLSFVRNLVPHLSKVILHIISIQFMINCTLHMPDAKNHIPTICLIALRRASIKIIKPFRGYKCYSGFVVAIWQFISNKYSSILLIVPIYTEYRDFIASLSPKQGITVIINDL